MKQLKSVHDSAVRGGRATEHGFMFKGKRLNAEVKSGATIRVWFEEDTEQEKLFDVSRMSDEEFVEHVEDWVETVETAEPAAQE